MWSKADGTVRPPASVRESTMAFASSTRSSWRMSQSTNCHFFLMALLYSLTSHAFTSRTPCMSNNQPANGEAAITGGSGCGNAKAGKNLEKFRASSSERSRFSSTLWRTLDTIQTRSLLDSTSVCANLALKTPRSHAPFQQAEPSHSWRG
eukprot:CAMPEP_0172662346 /NCGR_PEP_ID=MMETSP1074-20121228/5308_1 /TAXON_ID=2916 /ORGANISM="Ceratium fusus, Strain PA161109" /LENGTH=149 /DNA_ID=CAMNT_0013478251 /DNA_START=695 /DNA_END=1144 /DNA_ORIENTATION=+